MTDYSVITIQSPCTRVIPVSTSLPIGVGVQVVSGPPGPQGPAGNSTYHVFEFLSPSAEWSINHTLGRFPNVTVLDLAGDEVLTDIDRPSLTQVIITFASPQTGRVFIS